MAMVVKESNRIAKMDRLLLEYCEKHGIHRHVLIKTLYAAVLNGDIKVEEGEFKSNLISDSVMWQYHKYNLYALYSKDGKRINTSRFDFDPMTLL